MDARQARMAKYGYGKGIIAGVQTRDRSPSLVSSNQSQERFARPETNSDIGARESHSHVGRDSRGRESHSHVEEKVHIKKIFGSNFCSNVDF